MSLDPTPLTEALRDIGRGHLAVTKAGRRPGIVRMTGLTHTAIDGLAREVYGKSLSDVIRAQWNSPVQVQTGGMEHWTYEVS